MEAQDEIEFMKKKGGVSQQEGESKQEIEKLRWELESKDRQLFKIEQDKFTAQKKESEDLAKNKALVD